MLTSMEIDSSLPGAPALSLGGFAPNLESIQIRDIQGLGPSKAVISSTPQALARGDYFQGSSTSPRNIVLTLGLNANWLTETMSSLRHALYGYFIPESFNTYRFSSDDMEDVYIDGIVESFEPNIFSQDPEMQISIICSAPDFIALNDTVINGSTSPDSVEIDYIGTTSAGFVLTIDGHGGYSGDIDIRNDIGPNHQDFYINSVVLNATHFLELDTIHGERHVIRRSPTDPDNDLLIQTNAGSAWPEFRPGPNTFKVNLVDGDPGQDWTLTYNNRYGGL